MEVEYSSPTINKYSSGTGKLLQSSKTTDESSNPVYCLYVSRIPTELTRVSLPYVM